MTPTIMSAGRSTGSRFPCASSGRSSASASARRCSPGSSAPGSRRIRKAAPRSAIIRSARQRPATRSARTGRIRSTTGIAKGLSCRVGAELLAEGDDFPVQAFQSGHAFGFQFHPDVTYAMMHCWTTRGHERMDSPGAQPRASALRRSRGARRRRARVAEDISSTAGSRACRARSCRKPPNSRRAEFFPPAPPSFQNP